MSTICVTRQKSSWGRIEERYNHLLRQQIHIRIQVNLIEIEYLRERVSIEICSSRAFQEGKTAESIGLEILGKNALVSKTSSGLLDRFQLFHLGYGDEAQLYVDVWGKKERFKEQLKELLSDSTLQSRFIEALRKEGRMLREGANLDSWSSSYSGYFPEIICKLIFSKCSDEVRAVYSDLLAIAWLEKDTHLLGVYRQETSKFSSAFSPFTNMESLLFSAQDRLKISEGYLKELEKEVFDLVCHSKAFELGEQKDGELFRKTFQAFFKKARGSKALVQEAADALGWRLGGYKDVCYEYTYHVEINEDTVVLTGRGPTTDLIERLTKLIDGQRGFKRRFFELLSTKGRCFPKKIELESLFPTLKKIYTKLFLIEWLKGDVRAIQQKPVVEEGKLYPLFKLEGKAYVALPTRPDGDCALHALLGEQIGGEYCYNGDPRRDFIKNLKEKKEAIKEELRQILVNYLSSEDPSAKMLFAAAKGHELKQEYLELGVRFQKELHKLKMAEADLWLKEIESIRGKLLKAAAESDRYKGKSDHQILKMVKENKTYLLDLIDPEKEVFLSLLEKGKQTLIFNAMYHQDKLLNNRSKAEETFVLDKVYQHYLTVVQSSDFYLNTQEVELAALLFGKKTQVITSTGNIAMSMVNQHLSKDPIIIYHEGCHFSRCQPCSEDLLTERIAKIEDYEDYVIGQRLAGEQRTQDKWILKRLQSSLKEEVSQLVVSGGVSAVTGNPMPAMMQLSRSLIHSAGLYFDPLSKSQSIQGLKLVANSGLARLMGGNLTQMGVALGVDLMALVATSKGVERDMGFLINIGSSFVKGAATRDINQFIESFAGGLVAEFGKEIVPQEGVDDMWVTRLVRALVTNVDLQGALIEKVLSKKEDNQAEDLPPVIETVDPILIKELTEKTQQLTVEKRALDHKESAVVAAQEKFDKKQKEFEKVLKSKKADKAKKRRAEKRFIKAKAHLASCKGKQDQQKAAVERMVGELAQLKEQASSVGIVENPQVVSELRAKKEEWLEARATFNNLKEECKKAEEKKKQEADYQKWVYAKGRLEKLEKERDNQNVTLVRLEADIKGVEGNLYNPLDKSHLMVASPIMDKQSFRLKKEDGFYEVVYYKNGHSEKTIISSSSKSKARGALQALEDLFNQTNNQNLRAYELQKRYEHLLNPSDIPTPPQFQLPELRVKIRDDKGRLCVDHKRVISSSKTSKVVDRLKSFVHEKIANNEKVLQNYQAGLDKKAPSHITAPSGYLARPIDRRDTHYHHLSYVDEKGKTHSLGKYKTAEEAKQVATDWTFFQISKSSLEMECFNAQKQLIDQGVKIENIPPQPHLYMPQVSGKNDSKSCRRIKGARIKNKERVTSYLTEINKLGTAPIETQGLDPVERGRLSAQMMPKIKDPKEHGFWYKAWRLSDRKLSEFANWCDEKGIDVSGGVIGQIEMPLYDTKPSLPKYPNSTHQPPSPSKPLTCSWEQVKEMESQRIMQVLDQSRGSASTSKSSTSTDPLTAACGAVADAVMHYAAKPQPTTTRNFQPINGSPGLLMPLPQGHSFSPEGFLEELKHRPTGTTEFSEKVRKACTKVDRFVKKAAYENIDNPLQAKIDTIAGMIHGAGRLGKSFISLLANDLNGMIQSPKQKEETQRSIELLSSKVSEGYTKGVNMINPKVDPNSAAYKSGQFFGEHILPFLIPAGSTAKGSHVAKGLRWRSVVPKRVIKTPTSQRVDQLLLGKRPLLVNSPPARLVKKPQSFSSASSSSMSHVGKAKKIATKSANLPSWRKVKINIKHILSGHAKGGWRIPGSNKTLFPKNIDLNKLERVIRQVYKNGKKVQTQGSRVAVIGEYRGTKIKMWVDLEEKVIKTAYPIGK
ncbi:EndoU domain-containing protein [Candidatus Neptunochlamydia vexilliferae]|uniref:Bacterial EndoU nuclease domain-containing protein n=1 Tax=Candidatus Neptunichlamydia vexilliferae TaxID=1651774 RepID=A0ABS0AZ48_9BACT|nr:EndoU domain-containing protein [Candidatus Neptunochlamydia vexilliferae]MBF5059389.1 hypothetical protein [Candidatus Neptunochlamydia vexilliferae]